MATMATAMYYQGAHTMKTKIAARLSMQGFTPQSIPAMTAEIPKTIMCSTDPKIAFIEGATYIQRMIANSLGNLFPDLAQGVRALPLPDVREMTDTTESVGLEPS